MCPLPLDLQLPSGGLAKISVVRGEDVAVGAILLVIDNPELVAELHQAPAEKLVDVHPDAIPSVPGCQKWKS
jgi:hypothetical protein